MYVNNLINISVIIQWMEILKSSLFAYFNEKVIRNYHNICESQIKIGDHVAFYCLIL